MKVQIYAYLFIIFTLNFFSCRKFKSFSDDDEITTITSDNEYELLEAINVLNQNGGTIYIDTPVINIVNITLSLFGENSGGIIGKRQPNGEYPRLSFINNFVGRKGSGIAVFGTNKFIEYIIFEHSFTSGVQVFGSNNILDHVISRYNSGSGFLIHGDFNVLNYCYAYRNFNKDTKTINGDGYSIGGESNNVFNYCFAWDNSNSGFNYIRSINCSDLSYLHSGSWNNGNINVFTGKYDYDNGYPLDKNMWTVQEIIESDENYVSNYYNKKFSIENAKIDGMSINRWINNISPRMEGEGFSFGNQNSSQTIEVKRNSFYNVAFNNKAGGYVDNFNHKYNAFFTDCVSFNNYINYKFPFYTLSKWSNNWSWNSKIKDNINSNQNLKKPSNTNNAQRQFISVRDQIKNAVFANMFPDGVNFDTAIQRLN
jgi:hypothetical protein